MQQLGDNPARGLGPKLVAVTQFLAHGIVLGMNLDIGDCAANPAEEVCNQEPEPSNKDRLMVERNVLETPQKPELAMLQLAKLKLIVNGDHTENGLPVRSHVGEDSKHDFEMLSNKLLTAGKSVKENQQISVFATSMPVQLLVDGVHGVLGPNAPKHVEEELDTALEKLNKKHKTEENHALEVPTEQFLVTNKAVQSTVSGVNLVNGVDALKHVAKGFKQELDRWLSLLDLEDNFVQDIPLNLSPAIFKNVPRTVNGVTTASGVHAANHVAMELNPDQGTFNVQLSMEEELVLENQKKQGIVQRMPVQLTANGTTLVSGATAARIVVEVGNAGQEQ